MNPSSEREAFEAWVKSQPEGERDSNKWWCRQLDDGGYSCYEVDIAWRAYRAALSTPHQAIQDLIKARDTFGWSPEVDEKINALRSLSTQPLQAGWQMVPDGATKEMLAAACEVDWSNEDADGVVHNIWNAMLAAAPLPPVPGQEGGGA